MFFRSLRVFSFIRQRKYKVLELTNNLIELKIEVHMVVPGIKGISGLEEGKHYLLANSLIEMSEILKKVYSAS